MRQISPSSTLCSSKVLPERIHDADRAVTRRFEGLVVRAVLFRRLRHQADVGHAAHRLRVEGAIFLQNSTIS